VIRFTFHAADRYVERVNGNLTRDQALEHLERLADFGTVTDRPRWCNPEQDVTESGDCWLVVGDIAFGLKAGPDGLRATTCIPRGSFSAKIAQRRYEKRRRRGRARFAREQGRGDVHPPPPKELAA
jgi:hypothetical protein